MESKLQQLLDSDETLFLGALDNEFGIITTERGEYVDYLIIEYEDRFDVYLNLFDEEGEPQNRNIIVMASSMDKDEAKNSALKQLTKKAYGHLH